ncbi:hypothetical protein, partial [Serratia marcescens]|uniref:hypothetical protein n=1 Tax=Serratia marcescens TaxID=615 RepID=UPI001953BA54
EIQRYAHDDWRTAVVITKNGPFAPVNTDESITVYANGVSGTVLLTASSPIFNHWNVGNLFYIEQKSVD